MTIMRKVSIGAILSCCLLLVACGESEESLSKSVSGQPIECQWKLSGSKRLADYYFPYTNSGYKSLPDGKYYITLESSYENGSFKFKHMNSIKYIKKGSVFSPEYRGYWSRRKLTNNQIKLVLEKEGVSKCTIKSIQYKESKK